MKYIAMTVLALLGLVAFSLGMFELFDSPVTILKPEPEGSITFIDEKALNLKDCNSEKGIQIKQLMKQNHSCQSHADCQLKPYGGGCGNYVINNASAIKIDILKKEYDESCFYQSEIVCSMPYDPYQYEAMCIENVCQKAKMIDPETELKKYLETGMMFK
ncbi:hypothetical protein [Marinicella rhabdoformis]|uniref:hypothetical protein n=1 Tax=Marinicella rhabdoformis TaxID=2580566 RepID=UPI0012AECB6C|nr:hypothetical protein [Marinicella rhabdoformis]